MPVKKAVKRTRKKKVEVVDDGGPPSFTVTRGMGVAALNHMIAEHELYLEKLHVLVVYAQKIVKEGKRALKDIQDHPKERKIQFTSKKKRG